MFSLFLISLAITCILLQLLHHYFFIRPYLHYVDPISLDKPQEIEGYFLISVKNESLQIKQLLDRLARQKNIQAKIFIIDDYSLEDEYIRTEKICQLYSEVTLLQSIREKGKKGAIAFGIDQIPGEKIIVTDADCRPSSDYWAYHLLLALEQNSVVLGYGPFYKNRTLLNRLIRFECMWIASQYFGESLKQTPYMGVGRNMAFRKSTYMDYRHKIKGRHLLSGDDDMFVQAISGKVKTGIIVEEKAYMYSQAEGTYLGYLKQKTRHISTAVHYQRRHKLLLSVVAFMSIFTYPTIICSIFFTSFWVSICLIMTKITLSYINYSALAKKLRENDLILFIPLYEFLYGMHLVLLAIYALFNRTKTWR